jgi:two-component system, cell cycle sensor histidine kinase and response regulator CckA
VTGSKARRESWASDERYQQLVELAPDAILVHDGEQVVLGNAAAVRLAGATSREQLIGLPIDSFLEPPFLKAVEIQLTGRVIPADTPVRDTFRRLDGSEVPVEVQAAAFLDRGRASAHLVIRDISARLALDEEARQLEGRLHQAQRMEAVGALAGGVAHEINNMMGVILGFGEFLLLQEASLPADCLEDVREIVKAADRAAAVTRQLLAFSRRSIHRPRAVNLAAAIRNLQPVVRRLLGEGRRLEVVAEAIPRVWVDPEQLQQVVINLALNARDAMPVGGTLTITTRECELAAGLVASDATAIPPGRYAALVTHDTGAGMDVDTQAHLFEPFFTTKALGQGTGLGLAAVHGVVSQHNGYITVASAPGEGATFTIYLPILPVLVAVDALGKESPAQADENHAGATVLVVDDEIAVRAVVARTLKRGGFQVLQAEDGREALELVDRHGPPGLVLTDLTMPNIGGAELARRLKERFPALPIVFMSGYSAEQLRLEGAIDPEVELLQKPFSPSTVIAVVSAALAHAAKGWSSRP